MRRTYHSDRPNAALLRDVEEAGRIHGTNSPEYKRTYMRWYRARHPELRAAETQRLVAANAEWKAIRREERGL